MINMEKTGLLIFTTNPNRQGTGFAVSKGDKWIRLFIAIAILSMSAKLLGFFSFFRIIN